MSKAEEAAGIRLAEIAESWEGKELIWDHHDDWWKREKIEEAMSIVAAHDAERFRKPREPEDWENWENFLVIYWENGQWCGPFYGPLHDNARQDPAIPVMIADPIPLPPAPGGAKE